MKAMPILRSLTVIVLLAVAGVAAFAQTTSFTYQGELSDNAQPANGSYDFEFLLFDSAEGGTQLGDAVLRPGVIVTDGSFSVILDFGTHFTGANRFLEIRVAPSAASGLREALVPTVLSPRQPVMTVPYAMKSLAADSASTASDADSLGGVSAGQYVVTTDPRMTNPRPPTAGSGDYIQNTSSPQSSSNFNISGTGKAGAFDAFSDFRIAGNRVLSIPGSPGTPNSNTVLGIGAGSATFLGDSNSFFGGNAGYSNTEGGSNSFFGYGSGYSNTTGYWNSFFGRNSGYANTVGIENSFFGTGAGSSNTTGNANAFFGVSAGLSSNGMSNSFFGSTAGYWNTEGNGNSFFGSSSGLNNTEGSQNTFFGALAGSGNLSGTSNTALGYEADFGAGDLNYATAIGAGAVVSASNTIQLGRADGSDAVLIPGALSVSGSSGIINAATQYNIGGNRVLSISGSGNFPTSNIFAGAGAGTSNTTGIGNSFFGMDAGWMNTTGHANSFFGWNAGRNITTGSYNSFFGNEAGFQNTTGNYNTALGFGADVNAGDLFYATAIGAGVVVSASNTIQLGRANGSDTVFIPGIINAAGQYNIGGNRVLKIAGSFPEQGSSTFVGVGSGTSNISGNRNSFFGFNAGFANNGGSSNSFFGFEAGNANVGGIANSFFGGNAGKSNTSGHSNSFFGTDAGSLNTTGSRNAAFGVSANVASGDLNYATAIGAFAVVSSSNTIQLGRTDGSDEVLVPGIVNTGKHYDINGNRVLSISGTSSYPDSNTFLGKDSGTGGNRNTFSGYRAGLNNVSGSENSFFGANAGSSNESGSLNSFFGSNAGNQNTIGIRNSFFGRSTGTSNTDGVYNSFFGDGAGSANISGYENTFLGASAGSSNTTGGNNTALGSGANFGSASLSYATAIGSDAVVQSPNTIQLGRADGSDRVFIPGVLKIDTLSAGGIEHLCWIDPIIPTITQHNVAACSSSIRYKEDVTSFISGIELVERLRPVSFRWKNGGKLDMGLVAEEVAEIEPLLVTYMNGVVEGVKYDRIGVVLVNVVKEQQNTIEVQSSKLNVQSEELQIQSSKLKVQGERIGKLETELAALKTLVCALNPDASVCK